MSDKKISELPIIPEILDEDFIQIIDADEIDPALRNKRVLIPLLREFLTMPVDTVKKTTINKANWITGGSSGFYFDIVHPLDTMDLIPYVYDITGVKYDGFELAQYLPQTDSIYRVESTSNTIDIIVVLSTGGTAVLVDGTPVPASTGGTFEILPASWVPDGFGGFYFDILHGLSTKNLIYDVKDVDLGETVGSITLDTDTPPDATNTARVKSSVDTVHYLVTISNGGSSVTIEAAVYEDVDIFSSFAPLSADNKNFVCDTSGGDIIVTINSDCFEALIKGGMSFYHKGGGALSWINGTGVLDGSPLTSFVSEGEGSTIHIKEIFTNVFSLVGQTA